MTSSSDFFSWYTFTAQSGPLLLIQHLHPTLAFKPLILFPLTLYLLPLHPHHRLMLQAVSLYLLLLFSSLTPSRFFNGMLGVSEPGALNCYTLFRLITLTLFVSRNITLTHLPLSGFSALRFDGTHSRSGIFLLVSQTLAAASSFLSRRVYPSLSFLPPLFLCLPLLLLDPYVEVNIFLNDSSLLSFLNVYAPLFAFLLGIAEQISFLLSFSPRQTSFSWETSIVITPYKALKVLPTHVEKAIDWVISSDLLPLNDSDTPTLLHRSSPDISFALFSLFLSCSWEVLQNLGSDQLLTVPLSLVFRPNKRLPSLNFQKVCWDNFAFYFNSHCSSAKAYSSLFFSFAVALFTSQTLNALLTIGCSGQTALAYFLSALSLCGTEATIFFSLGLVCSSFSDEACAILQALCWSRQYQQVCPLSSPPI